MKSAEPTGRRTLLRDSSCLWLSVVGALLGMGDVNAQEICPPSIEISSQVRSVHPGWQAQDNAVERHALAGIAFTNGHPRRQTFLRAASSTKDSAKNARTDVYRFADVSAEGIWLVCQYRQTRQILFRQISGTVCEVTSTDRPDMPVTSLVCR